MCAFPLICTWEFCVLRWTLRILFVRWEFFVYVENFVLPQAPVTMVLQVETRRMHLQLFLFPFHFFYFFLPQAPVITSGNTKNDFTFFFIFCILLTFFLPQAPVTMVMQVDNPKVKKREFSVAVFDPKTQGPTHPHTHTPTHKSAHVHTHTFPLTRIQSENLV